MIGFVSLGNVLVFDVEFRKELSGTLVELQPEMSGKMVKMEKLEGVLVEQ